MKQTRLLMGMPITVEILESTHPKQVLDQVYDYFNYIDQTFSTYKSTSEISQINQGKLKPSQFSSDMKTILNLSEQTKQQTNGFFDIRHAGSLDPSGLVKGWAIAQAATLISQSGCPNYYVEAGGDIQVSGHNQQQRKWRVGIRNPFNDREIIKVVYLSTEGIATSGTYVRGQHIYDPFQPQKKLTEVVGLTVIGPNIYEADRFATAAFAMGRTGIEFIERQPGLEGYQIDANGMATFTSGFVGYTQDSAEIKTT